MSEKLAEALKMANDMELIEGFIKTGRFVGNSVHVSIEELSRAIRALSPSQPDSREVLKAYNRLTAFLVECYDPDFTPCNIYSADEIGDFQTDLNTVKNTRPEAAQGTGAEYSYFELCNGYPHNGEIRLAFKRMLETIVAVRDGGKVELIPEKIDQHIAKWQSLEKHLDDALRLTPCGNSDAGKMG